MLSFPGSTFFTRGDCGSRFKGAWGLQVKVQSWVGARVAGDSRRRSFGRSAANPPQPLPLSRGEKPRPAHPAIGRLPLAYRLVIALAFGGALTQTPRSHGSRLRRGAGAGRRLQGGLSRGCGSRLRRGLSPVSWASGISFGAGGSRVGLNLPKIGFGVSCLLGLEKDRGNFFLCGNFACV